jgi:hypothetical protein
VAKLVVGVEGAELRDALVADPGGFAFMSSIAAYSLGGAAFM